MVNLTEATEYITQNILNNEEFLTVPSSKQQVALNNAESQLKDYYGARKELPLQTICIQAIWLLRVDDALKRAEQGVTSVSVNGISISVGSKRSYVSPEVIGILGRRYGRYAL
jgi:hypothetical protein